jgi:hypothetical protein
MRSLGKYKKLFFIGILILYPWRSFISSQDVIFNATVSATVMEVGERFYLNFTLNTTSVKNLTPPPMGEFLVVSGPSTSQSTSVQIINGKMTRNTEFSYQYILQAVREGTFTIEPATVEAEGKQYQTQPITIQVMKSSKPRQAQPSQSQQATPSTNLTELPEDNLFVRVIPSTTTVYQGQYILATIKLYSKVDLSAIDNVKFPSFTGFFQQEIEVPPLRQLQREVVNGQVYGTGVLKQVLLFPQKSGELTIDPLEIDCQVRQRVRRSPGGFFDDFFDNYENVPQQIYSKPLVINVRAFPEGKPASFNGLTGTYTLQASLDKTDVTENDAITLKLTLSGEGNLVLQNAPHVDFPPDFECYDPKSTPAITNTVSGSRGSKTFEYLVIPRSAGNFRIAPVEIACFDPVNKSYHLLRSPEFEIHVTKSSETEAGTVISGQGKEALKFIGKDIRFIHTDAIKLAPRGKFIFGSLAFILIYGIALLVFLAVFLILRNQRRIRSNAELVKNRRANRMARRRLKQASLAMKRNNPEQFYEEVLKATWGYLSDKLNIPLANLSRETGFENLRKQEITEDLLLNLAKIIDACEYARFAPAASHGQMEEVFREAGSVISRLDQILR